MPQIDSTVAFANSTSYLLRDGGAVFVRLNSGVAVPYNTDEVAKTRVTIWCPTGNVYVAGETLAEIEPHLIAEDAFGSGSCSVSFFVPVFQDVFYKIVVLFHNSGLINSDPSEGAFQLK